MSLGGTPTNSKFFGSVPGGGGSFIMQTVVRVSQLRARRWQGTSRDQDVDLSEGLGRSFSRKLRARRHFLHYSSLKQKTTSNEHIGNDKDALRASPKTIKQVTNTPSKQPRTVCLIDKAWVLCIVKA